MQAVKKDLFCACEDGDLQAVKAMVNDGAQVAAYDDVRFPIPQYRLFCNKPGKYNYFLR